MKIYSRFDATKIVYEDDAAAIKETVENAVKARASLAGASLNGANLNRASLNGANLNGANLNGASFYRASLNRASLDGASLDGASLYRASLNWASLAGASLNGASLDGASLIGASLAGASLAGANLNGAKNLAFAHCPEIGAFTAFKRLQDSWIAVIEIPAEAKRTSTPVGRKCRAEFAKVIRIESVDGTQTAESGVSLHDPTFVYQVGEVVKADAYDDDIRVECSGGIHFYITRQEAVDY